MMYCTSHRRFRTLALAMCAIAFGCWSRVSHSALQIDVDSGFFYDSNLTRAYAPADIRADAAFTLDASAGSFWALSGADGLTLTAEARTELYHRFSGLNVIGAGATATYRHKFGLGLMAPWIVFAVTGAYDDYRTDIRDGGRLEARAELGKRFTPEFDAAFGALYERRYARNDEPVVPDISGRVFALRGQELYVRAGYLATDRLQIGAELKVRRGDVVATTRPDFDIFVASDAIAPDPAFGPDFFAYRLRGTTDTARISTSWAIDDHSSLNLVYSDERTDAAGGIYYRSHRANLTYAWRY